MKPFISPNEKPTTGSRRPIVNVKKLVFGLAGGLIIGIVVFLAGGSIWWPPLLCAAGASLGVIDNEPIFPASWFK
jgi:hypothetical protein